MLNVKITLQDEEELTEVVQLVGKDSLSEDQKLILEIAKVIKNDFLQQNSFTEYDYMCPLVKTTGMMKCIMTYFNLAMKTIKESSGENKKTLAFVQTKTKEEENVINGQLRSSDKRKNTNTKIDLFSTESINELPPLENPRGWHSMIFIPPKYIFIVGGDTKTVELFEPVT